MKFIGPNIPTDQILVKKVLQGDNTAFSIIIHNTERLVTRIVYRMISNHEDRKDIAQDVYLKAYQNLPGFRFQARLSTWIAQIAYNTCLNFLEKKKVILTDNLNKYQDPNEAGNISHLSRESLPNEAEEFIFQEELAGILKAEIERLAPLYRTLISLYHQEELSYAEIALITRLPEGTVKNYLFRARKILRVNLSLTLKNNVL